MLFETYVGSYVFNPRPHVSGAEDYYNRFVCLSVCLSAKSSEPTNIGTLKILSADVKSYKDQM